MLIHVAEGTGSSALSWATLTAHMGCVFFEGPGELSIVAMYCVDHYKLYLHKLPCM